jgi:hypothetical protein
MLCVVRDAPFRRSLRKPRSGCLEGRTAPTQAFQFLHTLGSRDLSFHHTSGGSVDPGFPPGERLCGCSWFPFNGEARRLETKEGFALDANYLITNERIY